MENPFETLTNKLNNIESLLLELTSTRTNDSVDESGDLMTIEALASYLHLSKATIYGKVSRKEIPYMKRGKRLYFDKQAINQYLQNGMVKSDAELNDSAHEILIPE